ncbi:MAG: hypothetical protein MJ231_01190 [bacterium]|nr:hypothetical protein [bacterium]
MNIALSKLAMLEKVLKDKEVAAQLEGMSMPCSDADMLQKISTLMDKVRNC